MITKPVGYVNSNLCTTTPSTSFGLTTLTYSRFKKCKANHHKIKTVGSNIKLGEWFRTERLKRTAGFQFVPAPVLMRNSKGGPLFFLFFASHNETGPKIVNAIFNKYRGYL